MTIKHGVFATFFSVSLSILFLGGCFNKNEESSFRIPIVFLQENNPCIQAEIEGEKYYFALDSGSDLFFSMNKQLLINIPKSQTGTIQTADIKGNRYTAALFLVDLIKIGKIQISNVKIKEESLDFILSGSVLNNSNKKIVANSEIAGRIGSKFLRSIDYWLIDFPNSSLIAKRNLDEISNQNNLVEVEMDRVGPHIVIQIQTAIGMKRFALDTGTSRSILRTPQEFIGLDHNILNIDQFIIGEHDFGLTKLYLFEMTSDMGFDGLLGRDFFEKYPVYLDFKNQKIYIKI